MKHSLQIEEVAKQTGPSAKVPHGPDDNPPSLKKFVERCFEDPAFKGSNRQKLQVMHHKCVSQCLLDTTRCVDYSGVFGKTFTPG